MVRFWLGACRQHPNMYDCTYPLCLLITEPIYKVVLYAQQKRAYFLIKTWGERCRPLRSLVKNTNERHGNKIRNETNTVLGVGLCRYLFTLCLYSSTVLSNERIK